MNGTNGFCALLPRRRFYHNFTIKNPQFSPLRKLTEEHSISTDTIRYDTIIYCIKWTHFIKHDKSIEIWHYKLGATRSKLNVTIRWYIKSHIHPHRIGTVTAQFNCKLSKTDTYIHYACRKFLPNKTHNWQFRNVSYVLFNFFF